MISGKLVLIFLAAMAGLSEAAGGEVVVNLKEGQFVRIPMVETDALTYTPEQTTALIAMARETTKQVTEYLALIWSDDFTNSLVAKNIEKARLLYKMFALARDFCDVVQKYDLSALQVERYLNGLNYAQKLIITPGTQDRDTSNSRFSHVEFGDNVMSIVEAAFNNLKSNERPIFHEITLNGGMLEAYAVDYISMLRNRSLWPSLQNLLVGLKDLSKQIEGCKPAS